MRAKDVRAIACTVLIVCGLTADEVRGTDAALDVQRIIELVRAREQQVRTVHCTWTVEHLTPKGALNILDAGQGGPAGGDSPQEDTVLQDTVTVIIGGQKLFWSLDAWIFSAITRQFERSQAIAAIVDGKSVCLKEGGKQAVVGPPGWFTTALLDFWPVLVAYRMLDPVLGKVKPEDLRVIGRAEHDGHPCVVLEQSRSLGRGPRFWWLAEDQDYCPVQWRTERADGTVSGHAALQFEKNEQGLWCLTSWDLQCLLGPGGSLVGSQAATVTELRLNEPVAPSVFEITFPPGTRVHDRFSEVDYVVGEKGERPLEVKDTLSDEAMEEFVEKLRREHLPAEGAEGDKRVAPAEQPKAPVAPPVEAVAPPRRLSPYHWLLIGCGVVLLVVAAGAALARRKAAGG